MRYVRYMYMRAAVRGLLEERLDRINANASRAATYLARAGLRGSEVATMEQLLCARADVLVMCARREGCSCGRGLESGFVSTIHSHRGMSGRSTPVWKSTSVSGASENSSLSHFSAMTRPPWLRRAASNRHRHAIEQASHRWRGGRRDDSARTRRKI